MFFNMLKLFGTVLKNIKKFWLKLTAYYNKSKI